jgi:serine/threonine protein kinase
VKEPAGRLIVNGFVSGLKVAGPCTRKGFQVTSTVISTESRRTPENEFSSYVERTQDRLEKAALATLTPTEVWSSSQGTPAGLCTTEHGTIVAGRYFVLAHVGAGAFGDVYKAWDVENGSLVALKMFRPEVMADPEVAGRLVRELAVHDQLPHKHPHIAAANSFGIHENVHFLVMEYINGTDLGRLVQKGGPLAVAQACAYIRQAALGLQHAHEHGLIHRDVKPDNILVETQCDGRWRVVVIDWGLVRVKGLGQLTQPGTILGTPAFCAPEQFLCPSAIDGRADVFSLGASFYFLLTGQAPLREFARWYSRGLPPLPAGLPQVLKRMTAHRASKRFASPGAVASVLKQFAVRDSVRLAAPIPDPGGSKPSKNLPPPSVPCLLRGHVVRAVAQFLDLLQEGQKIMSKWRSSIESWVVSRAAGWRRWPLAVSAVTGVVVLVALVLGLASARWASARGAGANSGTLPGTAHGPEEKSPAPSGSGMDVFVKEEGERGKWFVMAFEMRDIPVENILVRTLPDRKLQQMLVHVAVKQVEDRSNGNNDNFWEKGIASPQPFEHIVPLPPCVSQTEPVCELRNGVLYVRFLIPAPKTWRVANR